MTKVCLCCIRKERPINQLIAYHMASPWQGQASATGQNRQEQASSQASPPLSVLDSRDRSTLFCVSRPMTHLPVDTAYNASAFCCPSSSAHHGSVSCLSFSSSPHSTRTGSPPPEQPQSVFCMTRFLSLFLLTTAHLGSFASFILRGRCLAKKAAIMLTYHSLLKS